MGDVRDIDILPADNDGDDLSLQYHPDVVIWHNVQTSKYGAERDYTRKSFIHLN